MTSIDPLAVWHDHKDAGMSSFVEMLQVYTDKTTVSPKTNASVAYAAHNFLLNCSIKYCRYLIDHGYRFVGFLPIFTAKQESHSKIDDVVA